LAVKTKRGEEEQGKEEKTKEKRRRGEEEKDEIASEASHVAFFIGDDATTLLCLPLISISPNPDDEANDAANDAAYSNSITSISITRDYVDGAHRLRKGVGGWQTGRRVRARPRVRATAAAAGFNEAIHRLVNSMTPHKCH